METRHGQLIAALLLSMILLVGCGSPTPTPEAVVPREAPVEPSIEETQAPETDTTEEPTQEALTETADDTFTWIADGIIAPDEYTDETQIKTITLRWRHDGTYLYLAMEGPTAGWVSIGIEPTQGMKDADYLFGYVENGEAKLWDAYGTAPAGPNHPADEELGGTNDIVAFAGIEQEGVTRFELQIPLNSGDAYDKVLEPGGTYAIIAALGSKDTYNGMHSTVGRGELTLSP